MKKLSILGTIIGTASTLYVLWLVLISPTVDHFRYLEAEKKIESFDAKGHQIGFVATNITSGLVVGFYNESDPRPYFKYLPYLTGVAPRPLPFQRWDISPRYEHLLLVPGIQFLNIQGNPYVSDDSLKILESLPYLKELLLDDTKISNDGIKYAASCPLLEVLSLARSKVTANGLRPLFGFQRLRELNLWETKVGDKFVAALCDRPDIFLSLETINLEGTLVSEEAKEKLRSARRGLIVK